MRLDLSNLSVEVIYHSGMVVCSYRLPSGNLFKFRFIGYGKRKSVAIFKRMVRKELAQ